NEAACSCYVEASITRDTSAAGLGFDYPEDDARRWYARGYSRASWRIPFGPANRTSVSAAAPLPLKQVAKVSPAKALRCSRSASETDRFAIASGSPIPRRLRSALSPSHRADNRPEDAKEAAGSEFSSSSSAKPSIASPGLLLADTA